MDLVIAALAAGAASGLTNATSQAVGDAYTVLKAVLRDRFPQVDVHPLEQLPDSKAKQASLAEDLMRFGAVGDAEVVQLSLALLGAVERDVPQAATRAGVDVGRVRAEFLAIHRVAGGVVVRDAKTKRGVTITDVREAGGPDPNL